MLKKFLVAFFVLLGIVLVIISMQPNDFRISRSRILKLPATEIFPYLNDLHLWQEWSPWAKLDPMAKVDFSGPTSGEGASFHWAGNEQVGEGRMTITQSHPNEFVQFRLEFLRPFVATNTAEFTLKSEGQTTQVNWVMYGQNNFIAKAIGLIFDCDKMVGGEFEKGLNNLEAVSSTEKKLNDHQQSND